MVKIDADQLYLTDKLKEMVSFVQSNKDENVFYGIRGFNTFVVDNRVVKFALGSINGGADSFIIKRKNVIGFNQKIYHEITGFKNGLRYQPIEGLFWFHFMKSLKAGGNIRQPEEARADERQSLTLEEKGLFDRHVRPLLRQTSSPYRSVTF